MDKDSSNTLIVVVLIAFLVAIVFGTWLLAKALGPSTPAAGNANGGGWAGGLGSVSGGGGGGGGGASSSGGDGGDAIYFVRQPSDASFNVELPGGYSWQTQTSSEKMPEGVMIPVHRYVATGGHGEVDGFAMIRMSEYVDKRPEEMSQDDFLNEILTRYFQHRGFTAAGAPETIHRKLNDCLHIEGQGTEEKTQRTYYVVMEGFITNNDVILLMVAGYHKIVQKDPATLHFFETFKLADQE